MEQSVGLPKDNLIPTAQLKNTNQKKELEVDQAWTSPTVATAEPHIGL